MEQREFVVEQETAGQRIDRFLSGEDTGLSRSALQALVADGHVQCNGKTVAKSLKLKAGDTVLLEIPDAKPIEAVPQDIPLEIVYEDAHLLVVNTTGLAGVQTLPNRGHSLGGILPLSTSPQRQPGKGLVSGRERPRRARASKRW